MVSFPVERLYNHLMPSTFFTSDTHFGHGNVIRYTDRPWAIRYKGSQEYLKPSEILGCSVRDVPVERLRSDILVNAYEMDRVMIKNWNSVVGPRDFIYHLGDFSFQRKPEAAAILKKLNGKKILVLGNHDRSADTMLQMGFDEVYEDLNIELDGTRLYLHHEPEPKVKWGGAAFHLCGHVHEKWRRKGPMINVGVDQWDFTPRTLNEILSAEEQGNWPTPEEME